MSVWKKLTVGLLLSLFALQAVFCSEADKYYDFYKPLWEPKNNDAELVALFNSWIAYDDAMKKCDKNNIQTDISYQTAKDEFLKNLEAEKSTRAFFIASNIYEGEDEFDALVRAVENDDLLSAAESFSHYIYLRNEISRNSGSTYVLLLIFLSVIITLLIVFIIIYQRIFVEAKENEKTIQITMNAQETERKRISFELHDSVAQEMRYVSMLADSLNEKEIVERQKKCIEDIRAICYNLSPVDIERGNLKSALSFLCEDFMKKSGIDTTLTILDDVDLSSFDSSMLSKEQMHNIFRIVQELLSNIKKYAEATEVTVLIRKATSHDGVIARNGGLCIFVTDDGNGVLKDSELDEENLHFGLRNINARIKALNATIEYHRIEGNGTDVKIVMPL